ncbi:MAG TPA: TonB family protein [Allosphingosinicella sp.]
MFQEERQDRHRLKSALGVAVLHGLLGYALIAGFGVEMVRLAGDELKTFDVRIPPPPPATKTRPAPASDGPEGAASPENKRSKASPIAAPKPKLDLKQPSEVAAAPTPAAGSDVSSGAADRPGPGHGSGGIGDGSGSGRGGDGSGGGRGAKARLIRGRIVDSDYPRSASRARAGGTVTVAFTVRTDGHASGCRVVKSSGNAELDSTTCELIEQRFRYEPARSADGKAVSSVIGWRQRWWQEPR